MTGRGSARKRPARRIGFTVRALFAVNVLLGAALWLTAGPGVVLLAAVTAALFVVLASGRRRLRRRKT